MKGWSLILSLEDDIVLDETYERVAFFHDEESPESIQFVGKFEVSLMKDEDGLPYLLVKTKEEEKL